MPDKDLKERKNKEVRLENNKTGCISSSYKGS